MRGVIEKWDKGVAVRIPDAVLRAGEHELGASVEVRAECGRIVIEPVRQHTYDLDGLIKGINAMNVHKSAW